MDQAEIAAKVEQLREAQARLLRTKPGHIPCVMCPECGRMHMVSLRVTETTCRSGHTFENPHFGAETAPEPVPRSKRLKQAKEAKPQPESTQPAADREASRGGATKLSGTETRRQALETPDVGRVVLATMLYVGLILGGIAAGVYWFHASRSDAEAPRVMRPSDAG